jgi:HK97 family phage major capsid protein
MNEELKQALEALSSELEGKSKDEVKNAIESFEGKYKDEVAKEVKSVRDEFEAKLKEVQDHADKLDAKLQDKSKQEAKTGDVIIDTVKENFERIREVETGRIKKASFEMKAVANMTLGVHLTGDQPRDYSNDLVSVPGQLLNVADLAGSVAISGGTYTFPRETGGEGSIATQTEGSDKAQVDYDISMIDVNTDFIAGFAVYSRKMANNLPFLESWLPGALRRDYFIAENTAFDAVLAAAATASVEVITGQNKIEMLIAEIATLEGSNYGVNGIVVTPADYWDIMVIEKSTGAGYGLPGVVTIDGGQLRINGIPVYRANWVDANKYYVGDWSRVKKVTTQGLGLAFSEHDEDNFRKNNISARIEAQVALAVEQPAALIYGDFTAT